MYMAKQKKRTQREEVLYHAGQMAFIGAIIVIVGVVVTIAKAQGY
jgi:hypothetical protein